MALALLGASEVGAPVGRLIPDPVKHGYAEGRAWQARNAAKLGCHTERTSAMKSGNDRHFTDAERRCAQAEVKAQRSR